MNIRRRPFIASGIMLSAAPCAVFAQPQGKVWRVGYLCAISGPDEAVDTLLEQLRKLGYVEGRNIAYEYRWAAGRQARDRHHSHCHGQHTKPGWGWCDRQPCPPRWQCHGCDAAHHGDRRQAPGDPARDHSKGDTFRFACQGKITHQSQRSADGGADQIWVDHQPEGGKGPGDHDSAVCAAAG